MSRLALAVVLVAGLMGTIYAADPSFDCHKAKVHSIESVIRSSELLSALDREMGRLYKLATAPGSGARADAVMKEQMAWLKGRNQCAKMPAQEVCTRDRYLQRIAWLRVSSKGARGADDQGISIGPVVYRCDKTDGLVSVTFVNAEPRLVYLTRKNTRFTLERQPSGSGAKYMGGGWGTLLGASGRSAVTARATTPLKSGVSER